MAIKEFRNIEEYAQPMPMGMPRMPLNMYPMGEVPGIGDQISDHMKRHWLKYLLGGALLSRPSFKARDQYQLAKKQLDSLGQIHKNYSMQKQANLDTHKQIQQDIDSMTKQKAAEFVKANPHLGLKNNPKAVIKFLTDTQQKLLTHNGTIDSKLAEIQPQLMNHIADTNAKQGRLNKTLLGKFMGGNDEEAQLSHYQAPTNTSLPGQDLGFNYTFNSQPSQTQQADKTLGGTGTAGTTVDGGNTNNKFDLKQHIKDLNQRVIDGGTLDPKEHELLMHARHHPESIDKMHAALTSYATGGPLGMSDEHMNWLKNGNFNETQPFDINNITNFLTGQSRIEAKQNDPDYQDLKQVANTQALYIKAANDADKEAAQQNAQSTQSSQTTNQQTTTTPSQIEPAPDKNALNAASGVLYGPDNKPLQSSQSSQPTQPTQTSNPIRDYNDAGFRGTVKLADNNTNINSLVHLFLFTDNEDNEHDDYEYDGNDGSESYEAPKKKSGIGKHLGKILVGGAAAALGAGAIHRMANAHETNGAAFRQLGDVNRSREQYAKANVLRSIDPIHKVKQLFAKPTE